MKFKNATVFINGTFQAADFEVDGDRFVNVGVPAEGDAVDLSGKWVIPGLVECHSHGNSGADFSDGDYEGLKKMCAYLAGEGITSFAPTSMTLPYETLEAAFQTVVRFNKEQPDNCARVPGIHMEGPYFSEKKKGAQNGAYLKDPDIEGFLKLFSGCSGLIRIVDVAAELPGAAAFAEEISKICTVSVGHTDAGYDDAKAVFLAGASHATHLYNGMPGLHHRKPGVIGAAAEDDTVVAELICDGYHIHPSAIRAAFKLFPDRICLISDSLRCCGMPDGKYELGGQDVFLSGGVARLADGTLAGSATNLYQCMKNVIAFGIDKEQAIRSATCIPANELGVADQVGSIADGLFADFVICNENLDRETVYLGGKVVE